jgi:hypothetical protein
MKIKILAVFFLVAGFYSFIYSQDDVQIGSNQGNFNRSYNGGLFDYSDPSAVNIKVQLWGYVRFSGYYIVPAGTSINELISFAGGPTEDADLTDIRVTKIKEGSQSMIMRYNYNDLMWEDYDPNTEIKYTGLQAGDIVVVPGEPRYFVREDIAFYLGIVTTLASLTALILSILSFNN